METLISVAIFLGSLIFGYLCGSFPSAVIIGKLHGIDITAVGSKNAGGTNVGRIISKKMGVLTVVLDVIKTLIAVWTIYFIVRYSSLVSVASSSWPLEIYYYTSGLGAAIGHTYPIFANFKGGKAVSVYGGFLCATNWIFGIIGLSFFLGMTMWKKYVSFASICACVLCFLLGFIPLIMANYYPSWCAGMNFEMKGSFYYLIALGCLMVYVIFKHRSNIKRLLTHTERKIHWVGGKKKKEDKKD